MDKLMDTLNTLDNIVLESSDLHSITFRITVIVLFITVSLRLYIQTREKLWKQLWEEANKNSEKLKNDITKDVVEKTENGEIIKQQELDALGLMRHNLEDIKTYYTWSQQQAKGSFNFARIMSVAGFVLVVASVICVAVLEKPLELAIISAVGGVITELLAATVMIVYRNSMKQLNHYHQALHEDERFLSSINLIEKFGDSQMRDEMLKKIIESEIEMNLAGIHEKASANDETEAKPKEAKPKPSDNPPEQSADSAEEKA